MFHRGLFFISNTRLTLRSYKYILTHPRSKERKFVHGRTGKSHHTAAGFALTYNRQTGKSHLATELSGGCQRTQTFVLYIIYIIRARGMTL